MRPQHDFPIHDRPHALYVVSLTTLYINGMTSLIEEGRADEIRSDFYTIEELEAVRRRAQAKVEEFDQLAHDKKKET